MTRLVGAAHTDVGQVRSNNQDAALADPGGGLFAVADGMGGHRGGEVASALTLDTLAAQIRRVRVGPGPLESVDVLVDAVLGANEAVFAEARNNAELFNMGTTLCAVALVGAPGTEHLAVVNVGDSRVYLLRDGELSQLTEDHSLVQSLVRDGQITAAEAAVHPQRNILTRVIGVEPDVEVDWWEWPATTGDRYLLCSDGLFNEVTDAKIAATLRQLADPAEAARALVGMANDGGGRDNITCVVVDVAGDDDGASGNGGGGGGAAAALPDPGPTAAASLASALVDAPPPAEPRPRRLTGRVIGFTLLLLLVFGAAVFAIRTWARHNYFIGTSNGAVTIFRGRPDGILWFDPELVDVTDVSLARLTPAQQEQVKEGYTTSSHADALDWVSQLTTTTTAPKSVTTTTDPSARTTSSTAAGTATSAPTSSIAPPVTPSASGGQPGAGPPPSTPAISAVTAPVLAPAAATTTVPAAPSG